jgi:hypothetical protein
MTVIALLSSSSATTFTHDNTISRASIAYYSSSTTAIRAIVIFSNFTTSVAGATF